MYLPDATGTREEPLTPHTGQHALVIASNRLPIRFTLDGTTGSTSSPRPAASPPRSQAVRGDAVWIGWPGTVVPEALEADVTQRLAEDNLAPVFLSADEEEDFYGRVCNDTLWPLLHYFGDRLRLTPEAWQRYVHVNERFADVILERCGPDSRVWVHDFHLMLAARDAAAALAEPLDRLLPPHAVPVLRGLPAAARERGGRCAGSSAPTT